MSFTQGSPLPDITTKTTKATEAPSYYTDYLSGLSQAGKTAMSRTPEEAIAGYDPLQTQGYEAVPGAATSYVPGLSAGQQTLANVAGGISSDRIKELMNPYTQGVTDEMERLQQQSMQRSILPGLKAGFVGSGGLGGQRYAGALGQAMTDAQRNLLGQQTAALQSGYDKALTAALGELNPMVQAGAQQVDAAESEQKLGLAGAEALTKAGTQRQAYEQSLLDYPLKTATDVSALLRNMQIPTTDTTKYVGPGQQGQYGMSDLQNIGSILSLLGAAGGATVPGGTSGAAAQSILGGAGLSNLARYATDAVDWLGNRIQTYNNQQALQGFEES